MNDEDMAEAAEKEIKKIKRDQEKKETFEDENIINSFQWVQLMNSVKKRKAAQVFTGFNTMPTRGYQKDISPLLKDAHTNKGICQESYDQGYEDGLKAAKEGDTRIR